jgi:hypothetical protein
LLLGAVAAVPAAVTAQQDQVTITSTIVDQRGDSVGSGVDVTASWDGGSVEGTTSSNGQVLLDVPRGANVSIQIDDDQYVRNRPYTIEDASTSTVRVPVAQSTTAEITVRNADDETVEGARVLLYEYGANEYVTDQRTGADGTVTTPAIESGSYRLDILNEGYYTNRTRVSISGQDTLNSTIEQGEVLLTVSVVDDYFEPAESLDASVDIPGVGTLRTGSDGDTTTTVSVNTRYDVTVSADGYDQAEQTIRVGEEDRTTSVTLDRTDTIDIDAPSEIVLGQSVTLEATDEYDDSVTNATVTQDGEEVGTTDGDGEIRLTPESAGTVNYTVDDGDTQSTVSVEVFDPNAEQNGSTPDGSSPTAEATSDGSGPGFTPLTVVAAVALLSLVAYRRR